MNRPDPSLILAPVPPKRPLRWRSHVAKSSTHVLPQDKPLSSRVPAQISSEIQMEFGCFNAIMNTTCGHASEESSIQARDACDFFRNASILHSTVLG
jgi:hypothetical protein